MPPDRLCRLPRRDVGRDFGSVPSVVRRRAAGLRDGERHHDHTHREHCSTLLAVTALRAFAVEFRASQRKV